MPSATAPRGALNKTLLLFFAINLFMLLYFVVGDYQFVFHSDSAAKNLLAQEVYEQGRFFPPDWNYVNRDLWVFYTHLYIVPLLKFFPNGYALHAASSVVTSALVLLGSWYVGAIAGLSRSARLMLLTLLAAGISPNMVENLYGQGAYGTMYYSGCFLLLFCWRFLQAGGARRWAWGGAAFAAALLLFCANPQRSAIYYGLPLACGVLSLVLLRRRRPAAADTVAPARALALLAVLAGAAVLGALAHSVTLRHVNSTQGLTQASWLTFEAMSHAFLGTLQGLLSLLAGMPPPGGNVISVRGAFFALRLLAGVALLGLLPWALLRSLSWQHAGRLFFASATLSAIAVCLFINLTTSIPVPTAPESSIRYVVPGLLGMVVLLVGVVVDDRRAGARARGVGLATLLVLICTARLAYYLPEAPRYFPAGGIAAQNPKQRLADFLVAQDLRYGYATFWNAGLNTVLSDGKSRVRQIEIIDGLPLPRRHLAADHWYQPQSWNGPSFLLLGPEELAVVDWPLLTAATGQPARRLDFEGWQIVVFDHNIAADLPAWDLEVAKPIHFPISASTPHAAGRYDARLGTLEAKAGEAGALLFGPFRRLPPGRYEVDFDLDGEGGGAAGFGTVDATSAAGSERHAAQALSAAGRQRVTLRFSLAKRVDAMEFRVLSNGGGRLTVHGVDLRRLPAT
jgi:hypothetical protein